MKILMVAPSHTYPPVKGYQVMLCRHIEQLADHHSIDLIAFGDSSQQSAGVDPIKVLCNSVEIIPLPIYKIVLNLFRGIFSPDPLQVCFYRSKSMSEAVENRLRLVSYDVVIFQLTRMTQFLPLWYRGSKILNMVDPLVLNYERSLTWRPWYIRSVLKYEIARLRCYEAQHASRFDCVSLIAQADVVDYQAMLKNIRFELIPYGVDTAYFRPDDAVIRQPGMIVITGNMGYAPNVDAVEYFCREIFPLILVQEPRAHLWLVGTRPSSEIKKLGNNKNITVTGHVNDVRYYLNRAMVSVCPIRLNVGTQTKVLEALSIGTPVVTTSSGNQGIGGESGTVLYVADTPLEFSDRVVSLLKGHHWDRLSKNGRKFVLDHFKWESSAEKLGFILNTLIYQAQESKE